MTALSALVKREYLEHRAAFLYVPALLLLGLTVAISFGIWTGNMTCDTAARGMPNDMPSGASFYQVGVAGIFGGWAAYLLVGLFFYYADSFSADRRNNALLFWKSMPQSDLRVLSSKFLAGTVLFPALIAAFAMLTSVVFYLLLVMASLRFPAIHTPELIVVLSSVLQATALGSLYLFSIVLWYAPFLAWVAGLSTLFQRWSIPLAILLPGVVILLEYLRSPGTPAAARPIARFLAWRLDGFVDGGAIVSALLSPTRPGFGSLARMVFSRIDWLHMTLGFVVVMVVVYLASEYRRRRIEA